MIEVISKNDRSQEALVYQFIKLSKLENIVNELKNRTFFRTKSRKIKFKKEMLSKKKKMMKNSYSNS